MVMRFCNALPLTPEDSLTGSTRLYSENRKPRDVM